MASITTEPNGRKTVQFVGADRKRRSLRLGKVPMKLATAIKVKVEALSAAQIAGTTPDDETARWLAGLDSAFIDKLAAVGLATRRESREQATIGPFLDAYLASRADVKGSTRIFYRHTKRCLVEYFKGDTPLRQITPGDADEFRLWLVTHEKLAENTVRRRCTLAKQFFRAATRKGLIPANPFADIRGSVIANPKRFYFVTEAEARAVLDTCPDTQWRLLFALARYGGLRCPSEHAALRWGDVDWERGRMLITSPKTEHHPGGESRTIPIFPELRPYLEAAWDEAEEGAEFVVTAARTAAMNLRTRMYKIIRRAGLTPWPKLFQNLRSTRETELAESYPIHVVCAWIGNSQSIAAKHYLQVTDEHFSKAVRNPVQYDTPQPRKAKETVTVTNEVSPIFQGLTKGYGGLHTPQVGDEGLEISQDSSGKSSIPPQPGAESGAVADNPDLLRLVEAWPRLSESTRAAILALVDKAPVCRKPKAR